MQTIEEYKEYTAQLEGEVKNWHDAYNASQEHVRQLMKENERLERERVGQNAIIETCANELEELRKHELQWDLDKAKIKELNAENERLKKCEIWMKQHFYCEEVIACESAKNRRLKRALWLARAERAKEFRYKIKFAISSMNTKYNYSDADKWEKVERKCRKKAEEYK